MTEDRTWVRELAILLAGLFFAFVNVTLLVPVLPAIAARTGGASGAGLATAFFYFPAVSMQLPTPLLMERLAARWALGFAFALLAIPCFAYAAAPDSLAVLLGATAVRGAGFGIGTVAAITLVAELAPAARRGTAVGYSGLVSGIPPVFAPALGVYLLHHAGTRSVCVLAGAAGLAGATASLALPTRAPSVRERPLGVIRSLIASPLRWPLAWFGLVSLTRGAAISFVPLTLLRGGLASASTFLLLFGTFGYVTRWVAGRLADRVGPKPLVIPGLALSFAGLLLLAAGDGPAAVAVAGTLFGAGNGVLMTASQLDMLARPVGTGFAVPAAAWNIAIDCGFGLGGFLLGFVAAAVGYGAAFWILPWVLIAALALVVLEPSPRGDFRFRRRIMPTTPL